MIIVVINIIFIQQVDLINLAAFSRQTLFRPIRYRQRKNTAADSIIAKKQRIIQHINAGNIVIGMIKQRGCLSVKIGFINICRIDQIIYPPILRKQTPDCGQRVFYVCQFVRKD